MTTNTSLNTSGWSFEQYMTRCDRLIVRLLGIGRNDLPDSHWYDLYEERPYDESDGDLVDSMSTMFSDAGENQIAELLDGRLLRPR